MNGEDWRLAVSALGFLATTVTIALALRQYRRGEQWKRAEFVAKEIKEFEATPEVRTVYSAIDWTDRRLNLTGNPDADRSEWTRATRKFLWHALLPHEINARHKEWQPLDEATLKVASPERLSVQERSAPDSLEDGEEFKARFTMAAAVARDTFDVFFDGLSRFGNFIEAGLISAEEVQPYLRYWLKDLTTDQGLSDDAKWRCVVLTYMFVYEFQGAVTLFHACNCDIDPRGPLFRALQARMHDEVLFVELQNAALVTAPDMLKRAQVVIARQADRDALIPLPS